MDNAAKNPSTELMKGLKKWKGGTTLRIEYRWSAGIGNRFDIFGELLMGILGAVFFFTALFPISLAFQKGAPSWTIFIDGIFLLLGFLLLYRGLALLLNKSVFEVTPVDLVIRHKPLPLVGLRSMTVPIMEITGVEWHKAGHASTRETNPSFSQHRYSAIYDVVVSTNTGKTIRIMNGVRSNQYALAVASELSGILNR